MKRIIFICQGNIIRSPLAENLFRHLAREAGVDHKYYVESAGTSSYHVGEPPDARMRRVAADRGLIYTGSARQFKLSGLDSFDLIIALDLENRAHLLRAAHKPEQQNKIHLLREFDPQGGPLASVPDPYYGGVDGFADVYEIVERSCRRLLELLEEEKI